MAEIRSVCVYCGSSPGGDPAFVEAARAFGKILGESGIRLVYGGGSVGLMGALAASVLEAGGAVTGIIPDFLVTRERPITVGQEIIVTGDMHERKQVMFQRADAFVALPGGIGTLEELVEQMTWAQLGQHRKPVLLANINAFWDPLIELIGHMTKLAFIRSDLPVGYLTAARVMDIVPALQAAALELNRSEQAEASALPEKM